MRAMHWTATLVVLAAVTSIGSARARAMDAPNFELAQAGSAHGDAGGGHGPGSAAAGGKSAPTDSADDQRDPRPGTESVPGTRPQQADPSAPRPAGGVGSGPSTDAKGPPGTGSTGPGTTTGSAD